MSSLASNLSLVALLILAFLFLLFLLRRGIGASRGSGTRYSGRLRCPDCGSHDLDYISSMDRWKCRKCQRLFS